MEAGDGYRVFSAGRLRVDGGTGIEMPVRRLEEPNEPYFERVGFDGWDVLYTENEFFSARTNTETHTVSGILHAPGASRMTMRLNVRDGNAVTDTLEEGAFDVVDGRGVFSFSGTT